MQRLMWWEWLLLIVVGLPLSIIGTALLGHVVETVCKEAVRACQ